MPITRESYDRFSSNEEANGFVEESEDEATPDCQVCNKPQELINDNWMCLSLTCPSGAGKF